MQASKIKIGDTYAVRLGTELARFRVREIETTRNMSRTENKIKGELMDAAGGFPEGHRLNYDPADILGPYQEQAELVDRERQRKEAQELKEKQATERGEAIFTAFLKLIGHPKPKKVKEYGSTKYRHDEPFRLNYSNTIELNREGMEILAKFFKIDVEQKLERAPGIHERMGGVQMTDAEFKQAQEDNDPAPTNQT